MSVPAHHDGPAAIPPAPLGDAGLGDFADALHQPAGDEDGVFAHNHTTGSRVDIGHFDPAGVDELRRTMSRRSEQTLNQSQSADAKSATKGDEPFDFEKVLRSVMQRQEDTGHLPRSLGVVFEDLRVTGLGASASFAPTLGSFLSPFNKPAAINALRHPPVKDILRGFEGCVRPGEMLLVLGSPGSGCSTLLKTLANQTDEYHAVGGTRHYDSLSPEAVAREFRGDVVYCPEDDVHFPTLTVHQTLAFAARTRTPAAAARLPAQTRAEHVDQLVSTLMTVFGLTHARDTPVGDASIRGVSGGEKKRVSICESLCSRGRLGCWDNSTRGLDASTALEFVRALRLATDIAALTTIVSIYQAAESLYTLFDKVCVVYPGGRLAYFGPADQARAYFEGMGWAPAPRQTTADFLVACTDPAARIASPVPPPQPRPRTADEFAKYFLESAAGARNRADIAAYKAAHVGDGARAAAYKAAVAQERAPHFRLWGDGLSAYTVSVPMQVRAVVRRRAQILRGGMAAQVTQFASFVVQAIIMGTVFLRVADSTGAYFSRGGVLFFSLLFAGLTAMAEIPALFAQRPIVLRHMKAGLYHPFVEAVALTIVDVPITAVTLIVFSAIVYEAVRLQQSAGQFFIFFLLVFTLTLTMKGFFRALAAAIPAEAPAQAVAGVSILIMSLYTGYSIPKPSMIGALRWLTYVNPIRWGFEGALVNEFHTLSGQCASLVPQGPGYEGVQLANQVCTTVGSVAGQATVNGDRFVELSYGYSYGNLWRNYGIVVAYGVFFIGAYWFFTERNVASVAETSIVLFKQGAKAAALEDAEAEARGSDEEKTPAGSSSASVRGREKAPVDAPAMTDIFSWQHVQYVVPVGGGEKRRLLDDVSGYVVPGKLTALMGESGAGKTTLLNVLAQRVSTGVVTGDRLVNGQALPDDFQAQTGYCQQMDTHEPTATVREALLFSAHLRQPASVPAAEKAAYVETCLRMCGLAAHGDALVGSLGIEHRKRTTIAVELAAKPKLLLFLDEPTSGLDSQSAWAIMQFLRSLADGGQAILCTIHQPSSELFQVFDRLLLLKKGGQTVYFGDLGRNSATLIGYFERQGARACGAAENPAEYILESIGAGATASAEQDWHALWKASPEHAAVQREVTRLHDEGATRPAVTTERHSEFATAWGNQTRELLKRGALAFWRNPTYLMAKLVLNISGGLLIGFTFFKAKDTVQGTQNKLFAIFMATILSVPLSNQIQVPFLDLRNIYTIRERPSRMYSWTALITAQYLTELPWNILGSSIFFLCWFFTVGFPADRAGYTYFMIGLIFPAYYTSIAMAVAAMAPNAQMAGILFSFLFSFVLTFNGVLQPFRELGWWAWMYRLSPYTYLVEGLVGQAVGKIEVTCAPQELVTLQPPSGQTCGSYMESYLTNVGGYLNNPNATSACEFCSIRTTDQFLENNFNIFYSHHWRNLGLLVAFIAFNIRTRSIFASIKSRLARRKST
ncbi:hypothetical protein HWV62_11820 [Athelia sp. TMB]|nr:hypothetical protein HWV62_11820 [Athelia sp. TMB]